MDHLLVIGHKGYSLPFREMFKEIHSVDYDTRPKDYELYGKPDMLLFTGGEDICPSLYGEPYNGVHYVNNKRDSGEVTWFNYAVENKIPMFGTCRGMQLFTALTGGKLIQDVSNHHGYHKIYTNCGKEYEVNSIHHQMCLPSADSELLAWSKDHAKSKLGYPTKNYVEWGLEPEAIYFPKINALGVQWHPEGLTYNHEANKYVRLLTKQKLFNLEN